MLLLLSMPAFTAALAALLIDRNFGDGDGTMFKDFTKTKAEDRLDALAGIKSVETETSRGIMRQEGGGDADVVDASNLQRQVLHATSRVGQPKVESAEKVGTVFSLLVPLRVPEQSAGELF